MTERVATVGSIDVTGTFYRHAARGRDAFAGGPGGRWGATFPVIYLGRPQASIVVEAYRHLVEEAGVPAHLVKPRTEYVVPVAVTRILDLRNSVHLALVGLADDDVHSLVDDYDACQAVAAAAHQLRLHGVLAPAATGLGETLALFRERLPAGELPVPSEERQWEQLPADPRSLRHAASS
ncbi:RES domain-containing protein [Clavibacter michiganensis]|uniref:RES domain-containing protein n=1 Tax=Clavibacter michiganensis TaxID=28447 RepID=UPI001303C0E2|nr:RES domain-containing protein [Clavibacter michiganensis]MDO4101028.1 RES domain-containing protein [Clavibacter michiganensis]MDO4125943.1 RES domain-containing protein [Clavibacter michiganensis]MDO4128897.1 RES domain-containing protein [Clavibacter michiganensis]MDO4141146.1 RES domain-containing protein [Clavibacter michiganensis]NIY61996.1 RES domain-containing protein [Clavibacter michiganensis subsp. michiganensis]